MSLRKSVITASLLLLLVLAFAVPAANASKPSEYDLIVNHLKSNTRRKRLQFLLCGWPGLQ